MIARPGWARRWWRAAYVTFELLTLLGLVFGIPALIWMLGVANGIDPR